MRTCILTLATSLILAMPEVAPAGPTYTNYGLGLDNVIVSGTMTASNGDVEGRTVVGGNLTTSGVNYAIQQASTTTDTLVVGGNLAGNSIPVDTGTTRYGGTLTGSVNDNSGVPAVHDTSVQGLSGSLGSYLTGVSNGFFGMASTNTTANPAYTLGGGSMSLGDQNSTLTFNAVAGSNGVAVINIDASLFNNGTYKGQPLQLNVVNDGYTLKEIVFNVSGTTADLNINGGFGSSFQNSSLRADTLFNFYQATSITTESNFGYFQGDLLAPDATYTNHADNNGSVYVANFDQMSEVHLPSSDHGSNTEGFEGPFVASAAVVPEPATVISTVSGLAIVAGAAWRRRRRG